MRRRRIAGFVIVLVAIALTAVVTWRASVSGRDATDFARGDSTAKPSAARPRQRAEATSHRTDEPRRAVDAPAPAAKGAPESEWYRRLQQSLATAGALDRAAADAILAEAGKGRPPGDGLLEVLRRADSDLRSATTIEARERARSVVEWTIDEGLRPYREDRALLAATYREVRFGEGRLDLPGGSLVREYKFDEAAARLDALRPKLRTQCFDALAIRIVERLGYQARAWRWFRQRTEPSSGGPADGASEVPEPGSELARTMHPTAVFDTLVRPRLRGWDWAEAFGIGIAFLELGEPDVAQTCFDAGRRAMNDDVTWSRLLLHFGDVEAEVRASRDLRTLAKSSVPASPGEPFDLSDWFARHRRSGIAHAIGGGGRIEIGEWDDEMTRSWLANGLAWAPQQWESEREWRAAAFETSHEGIRGWTVRSQQWEVFSDASADVSSNAALVLEAAWMLARDGTGVAAFTREPIGARIYRRRSDYEKIALDGSRGEWDWKRRSVLTFLDDSLATDFDEYPYPVLVHEATHAVLSFGVGGVPSWINEGLACFIERWNPTASVAVNRALTKDWVRRPRKLEAARDAGLLPTFDQLTRLVSVKPDWVPDDFGPVTVAHYAAAESLFVYLADDSERWKMVGVWLDACRRRQNPAGTITDAQREEIAKGWGDVVEFICGRVETR